MLIWLFIVIASLAAMVFVLETNATILDTLNPAIAAVLVIVMLFAAYTLISNNRYQETGGGRVKKLLAGLLVAAALTAAKVSGVFPSIETARSTIPVSSSKPYATNAPAAVKLRKRNDGVFLARGSVNGVPADFIVDSGAAAIMLRQSDAQKAGIDVAGLSYDTPIETAGGTTFVAPVRLRIVTVGPLALDDLEAFVARPGSLNENLLGHNFLRRLRSYEVSGEFMTLRK